MITFKKNIVSHFPLGSLRKVSDLIYYEGPILSHFVDETDNNILYYWVDQDEKCNRWLVWYVSKNNLRSFLLKETTLYDLVKTASSNIYFLIDINDDIDVEKTCLLKSDELPNSYLPPAESYLEMDIPDIYNFLLDIWAGDSYIEILKDKAFYLKLESREKTFRGTFDIKEVSSFLKSVSESYSNFIDFKSYEDLRIEIKDPEKLLSIQRQLRKDSDLRLVYLNTGSLEFGLAPDIFMNREKYGEFATWRSSLIETFKNEVVNLDYSSSDAVKEATAKFPEIQRFRIFSPFVKAISSNSYKVSSFELKTKKMKEYRIKKEEISSLLQVPQKLKLEEQPRKVISAVFEVGQEDDIKEFTKGGHQYSIIYQEEVNEFSIKLSHITSNKHNIEFRTPIILHVKKIEGIYEFSFSGVNFVHRSNELKVGQSEVEKEIVDVILFGNESNSIKQFLLKFVNSIDGKLYLS